MMCSVSRKSLSTKSYSPGDVIASSPQPLVHIVLSAFKSQYCDYCLNDDNEHRKLKRCTKCHFMYYCDSECQSSDWKIHKLECKLFAKHMKHFEDSGFLLDQLLLLRLILIHNNYPEMLSEKYSLHDGQQRCFNELMSHETEIKRDEKKTGFLFTLMELLVQFNIRIKFADLCRLYGQMRTNNYALFFYETNGDINSHVIGYCISIPVSVFNHSCLPNASAVTDGIATQVRALTHIKRDEEICVSYIDFESPKLERQLELNDYYFQCNCVKCETNSDQNFDYKSYHELLAQYRYSLNGQNSDDVMKCIKLGEEALKLRKELCQYYHPSHSILMFVQVWQLINATFNYEVYPLQQFHRFVTETEQNLKITYGCDHKIYKMFSEIVMH